MDPAAANHQVRSVLIFTWISFLPVRCEISAGLREKVHAGGLRFGSNNINARFPCPDSVCGSFYPVLNVV